MQQKPERSAVEQIADSLMTNIPKDFLFEGMALPATIYYRMKEDHYLVIGRKNDKANLASLHSFRNPNFLVYVRSDEYKFLINYVTTLTEQVIERPEVPAPVKSRFMNGLVTDALGEFTHKSFTSTQKLEKISNLILSLSQRSAQFDDLLRILEDLPRNEAKHSMATALVALSLCEEMSISHDIALEKMVFASLLHDVGMKFIPPALFEKPMALWTAEEMALYEQHPARGAELLRDVKGLHADVLIMLAEHHEHSDGTGFPKRIRDVKISPLGKILAVSSRFADLLFPSRPNETPCDADQAVDYIQRVMGQPFNKGVFLALKNIINKQYLAKKQAKAG